MTDIPSPPSGWTEAAKEAAAELGLETDWSALDAPDWARLCRRAGEIVGGQGHALAPGWDGAPDELARDTANTVLAEKGEVFAPEDDA